MKCEHGSCNANVVETSVKNGKYKKNLTMKKLLFSLPVVIVCWAIFVSWQTDKGAMERGKKVYNLYCLSCHAADGKGMTNLNPPLIKTPGVTGNKTKLVQVILKGMDTHEEINGQVYTNTMAPLDYLTDQQIADVLTYIRNSFGNKATGFTAAEVKSIRAKTN
jgi:mono/diheme cytochrome c family protein